MYLIKVGCKWVGEPNKYGNHCLVSNQKHACEFKSYDKAFEYADLVDGKVARKA